MLKADNNKCIFYSLYKDYLLAMGGPCKCVCLAWINVVVFCKVRDGWDF